MFETLVASSHHPSVGPRRYALSTAVHAILVLSAVALTRQAAPPVRLSPPEPVMLSTAPLHTATPLPRPRSAARVPSPPRVVQTPGVIPDLKAPLVPSSLPTVTGLTQELTPRSGPVLRLEALTGVGGPELGAVLSAETVEEPVRVLEASPPRYPTALATAGVVGRVELSYVVDTLGRAEPGSLRTLASSHPAFEAAARASVLATRYRPARWHGRPVRQLVRQALTFRLGQ